MFTNPDKFLFSQAFISLKKKAMGETMGDIRVSAPFSKRRWSEPKEGPITAGHMRLVCPASLARPILSLLTGTARMFLSR